MPDKKRNTGSKNMANRKTNQVRSKKNQSQNKRLNKTQNLKQNPKQNSKQKQKSKVKKIIIWTVITLFVLLLVGAGILAGIIFGMFKKYSIPIDKLRISSENTRILDSEGNVIAVLNAQEKRDSIRIDEMGRYLPAAFVAIEDERFYEHQGVDVKRTAAATISYVLKGDSSFGGSTITQQLVKNITKDDERDATRKIKEMARAYNLEKTLTKDEILELYLNMIFLGEDVYGVQMASRLYFDKNASELDLAEAAFIAGINNSPNAYKPFSDDEAMKERIKTRTLTVINKMKDLGKIESDEVYNTAIEKVNNGLVFTKGSINANVYSYHTDAVIEQVLAQIQEENPEMTRDAAEYYLYNGGLTIYSTQVTSIQTAMEEEYNKTTYVYKSSQNYVKDSEGNDTDVRATTQSAMTIIDQKTGQVVATVGGFGEKTSRGLNRATQQPKQPGSTIKPIAVIAPSLEAGLITAGTVIDDSPVRYGNWAPKNSGGGYRGLMTVRDIIKVSENIPEVKMINNLGVEKSLEFLKNMGLTHLCDDDLNSASLALGGLTNGVTTFEMAGAYAAIANDGQYIEPTFYTKVEDADGNVVLEAHQERRTVMSADNAYILKTILRGPVSSGGTYPAAKFSSMDICGKTGTTDAFERWFCGFTPYYTAATWYGFDKSENLGTGNNAAAIWTSVMKNIHEGLEVKTFQPTSNIVSMKICTKSGLIPTDICGEDCIISEQFVKGTAPTESCKTHVLARVCVQEDGTKQLATEFCPNAVEEVFITRPNSDTDTSWQSAADAGEMLPTENCQVHTQSQEPEVPPTPDVTASPTPSVTPSPTPPTQSTALPIVSPSGTPPTGETTQPIVDPSADASEEPTE